MKAATFDISIMCERINEMVNGNGSGNGNGDADKYEYRAILFYGRPSATVTAVKYPKAHMELVSKKKVVLDFFYAYSRFAMVSPSADDMKKKFTDLGFSYPIILHTDIASHGIMTLLTHPSIRPPLKFYQFCTC